MNDDNDIPLIPMEVGVVEGFRFIQSPLEDFPDLNEAAPVYDANEARRQRFGNNKVKPTKASKRVRAKIAKASRRRNRK